MRGHYRQANKHLLRASSLGDARAMYLLGISYYECSGVRRNEREAMRLFERSAAAGYPLGMYAVGYLSRHGTAQHNPTRAVEFLRRAADAGICEAQYSLGVCYSNGEGTRRNLRRAFSLYQQAAKGGDPDAQFNLAFFYERGRGVRKNLPLAIKWYRIAIRNGSDMAALNLGVLYSNGNGVIRSQRRAVRWYIRAALRGNVIAMENISKYFSDGVFFPANPEMADLWHNAALTDTAAGKGPECLMELPLLQR